MFFFPIILGIGLLTTFTDLKSKTIYNQHLLIAALLGLAAVVYSFIFLHETVSFHIVNGLVAFLIGFGLYRSALWKGGDAKLFALYAYLMPTTQNNFPILFSDTISLFTCIFSAGMIILLPVFIKDVISNSLLSSQRFKDLARDIKGTIFFSWAFFPVYYFTNAAHNPIISMVITYCIFNLAHYIINNFNKNRMLLICGFLFGFLMRYWLAPNNLSWQNLLHFILKFGLWSAFCALVYTLLGDLKQYRDRVPFAPILFIGCILCYTSFLSWLMHLTRL